MSQGARSNAYTDFHHTVFHVHSPSWGNSGGNWGNQGTSSSPSMLPLVLETLEEIAFFPQFSPQRIEKERRAILSEMQMMNTIEYRVDCQLLMALHEENALSKRFPIGKEDNIVQWSTDQIQNFHKKWYFPGNATLYLVGDLPPTEETIALIQQRFGRLPLAYDYPPDSPNNAVSKSKTESTAESTPDSPQTPPSPPSKLPFPLSFLNPFGKKSGGSSQDSAQNSPTVPSENDEKIKVGILKERHIVRPPVDHRWSWNGEFLEENRGKTGVNGYLPPPEFRITPRIFQHELLQNFSLSIFCKVGGK